MDAVEEVADIVAVSIALMQMAIQHRTVTMEHVNAMEVAYGHPV